MFFNGFRSYNFFAKLSNALNRQAICVLTLISAIKAILSKDSISFDKQFFDRTAEKSHSANNR